MRVFISSVIGGFEEFRDAALAAIRSLGHDVIRAEDFVASPRTPQVACLAGVREADAVVLILGSRYGQSQQSGKSPTHEEFIEARDRKPVFVFVQSGVTMEPDQTAFITEVQSWTGGSYVVRFSDAEGLRSSITTAIHRWVVANAAGNVDSKEMIARAVATLPAEQRGYSTGAGPCVALSMAGAPRQPILRPSELEAESFHRDLTQRILFDTPNLFSTKGGIETSIKEDALVLSQGHSLFRVSSDGALLLILEVPRSKHDLLPALIEEDVRQVVSNALQFSAKVMDLIDAQERISHIAIALGLLHASHYGWRTRREHERNPTSITMSGFEDASPIRALLSPPIGSRFRRARRPSRQPRISLTPMRATATMSYERKPWQIT